jgi:riboflavin-specific deaminase-like protein
VAQPLVTLHFAQSLDGRIALGAGCERAILSSEEGLVCAHHARSSHDAVLVGIETALHDDPRLTARGALPTQPLRIVLDSELRLPLDARLLVPDENAGQVLVFGCWERASAARRAALEAAGALVLLTSSDRSGRVALVEALAALEARGVRRLLVEGGAKVLTSFLHAGLAARAEVEIAPLWLGEPATPGLCELGVTRLGQALRLEHVQVERLGQNMLLRGDIVYPSPSPQPAAASPEPDERP